MPHQATCLNSIASTLLVLALAFALLTGCSTTRFSDMLPGSGTPELRSSLSGNSLPANLPTRIFAPSKIGVADLYLTDLPEELLRNGGDLSTYKGIIIHVHSFLRPRAGKTPIDPDATTAVTRVFVLTGDGNAGLYAGGGLFLTSDDPKAATFEGSLRGATLYLSRATAGFDDLLGPSRLAGLIAGKRDEVLAAQLATITQTLAEAMDSVE